MSLRVPWLHGHGKIKEGGREGDRQTGQPVNNWT